MTGSDFVGMLMMLGVPSLGVYFLYRWRMAERELAVLRGRRVERYDVTPLPGEVAADLRFAQLEQGHDTLVAQMDRLAESQEFLTRVLMDRIEPARTPTPRPVQSITPH